MLGSNITGKILKNTMSSVKFVGFWKGCDKWTQMPVANSSTTDQREIISKIKLVQKFAKKTSYRGLSPCRICHDYNGSEEYAIDGFVWPSGYIHYLKKHNVAIDEEFSSYVCDFDRTTEHDISFEYKY